MPAVSASAKTSVPRKVYGPDRILPKRPPSVLQVVRNPASMLAIPDIDWTAWYLTEEQDEGESWPHAHICHTFETQLRCWVALQRDPHSRVGGNVFFQWVQSQPLVQISPDAFVVDSAPEPLPASMQLWLPGHLPPQFALEVVSEDWHKDYDDNPPKYAMLGCKELAIYDPEYAAHRRSKDRVALQVYRRAADGIFARAYAGDGPAYCVQLGAWLVMAPDGSGLLRIARDAAGLDLVPTADEQVALVEQQAAAAQHQAAIDRQSLAEAEAENARLCEELARLRAK